MLIKTFMLRVKNRQTSHLLYSENGRDGLVRVMKFKERIILTWDEYPTGKVEDEAAYSHKERHEFATVEEVIAFLAQNNLNLAHFTA